MYFRHHSIEIYAKDILKLDFPFWANDCPLAELCVKNMSEKWAVIGYFDPKHFFSIKIETGRICTLKMYSIGSEHCKYQMML